MKYVFSVLAALFLLLLFSLIFWAMERTPLRDRNLPPWSYKELTPKNIAYLFALLAFVEYHTFDFILNLSIAFNHKVNLFLKGFGYEIGLMSMDWAGVFGEIVLIFLLADLVTYINHRFILHGPLWKYHAIHHSEKKLGWYAAYQFHPVDFISHRLCYVVVFFLGVRPETLIFFTVAYTYGLIQHSRINIRMQPFAWLLATPQFHRLHHRLESAYHNKNFATWLSVWDRLLGTHATAAESEVPVYGVPDGMKMPDGFWKQMWFPFRSVPGKKE